MNTRDASQKWAPTNRQGTRTGPPLREVVPPGAATCTEVDLAGIHRLAVAEVRRLRDEVIELRAERDELRALVGVWFEVARMNCAPERPHVRRRSG